MDSIAPIEAHGMIGDGRACALISSDGTVDWLSWPRFDSEATFAALLHDDSAGAWRLRPLGSWTSSQRYLPKTNVLVTEFRTRGARLTITDLMPVASEKEEDTLLLPEHQLLRVVDWLEGEGDLQAHLRLAPGFGRERLHARQRRAGELCIETRRGAFFIQSEHPMHCENGVAMAQLRMRAGDRLRFSLTWSPEGPAVLPPLIGCTEAALDRTIRFWRKWVKSARYRGPYQDAVVRSALAIKLLQYPPSGAFLAAATTSLPERIGGPFNWDYRYCWLRDASFTARCLYGLGFRVEADAFVYWLMHTTQLTQPRLAVLYDVYGNAPRKERELGHLRGYRGSRPVRIGNAADGQLQLDLHGEVIDAICAYVKAGGRLERESRRMLCDFGRYVASNWHRSDASLWEYRTAPEQHTHSKVLCWTALDRLLHLHRLGVLPELDASGTVEVRDLIALTIRSRATRTVGGGYASVLDGSDVDAALLLLPWYGFDGAASPRMKATLRNVVRQLGAGGGLLYRNERLRSEGDGAFLAASFWGVECMADGAGTLDESERWFEQLLRQAGPLGLYAEEVDARTGCALGNFPQAYSHIGLISAAIALEERRESERKRRTRRAPDSPISVEARQ